MLALAVARVGSDEGTELERGGAATRTGDFRAEFRWGQAINLIANGRQAGKTRRTLDLVKSGCWGMYVLTYIQVGTLSPSHPMLLRNSST